MHESRRDRLLDDLEARLGRAEQVVVCGPSGIGKTRLLSELGARFIERRTPCALSPVTSSLRDITSALGSLFPEARRTDVGQRRLRSLLRNVAEVRRAVLLLDHVTRIGTASKGFLRSLRGMPLGVAFAVDVDAPRDKLRMRRWCLSSQELVVPSTSRIILERILTEFLAKNFAERGADAAVDRLVEAAAGRPGYVVSCIRLMHEPRYWAGGRLHVALLQSDAEIATRNRGGWGRAPLRRPGDSRDPIATSDRR